MSPTGEDGTLATMTYLDAGVEAYGQIYQRLEAGR